MKYFRICFISIVIAASVNGCESDKEDFSGTYCLSIGNLEMTISQAGDNVTFTLQSDLLNDGTGTITGDTIILTARTAGQETFTGEVVFSKDRKSFAGPFKITGADDKITMEGVISGNRGECPRYDISARGIPKFVGKDFTQLSKIEMISRFRSGFGHSFTDGFESCRSMKHYYNPFLSFRQNNTVEIYSPVKGSILSVLNDSHGGSPGLKNKEIQIKPDEQPAFVIVLFHCDLISDEVTTGKKVQEGELLGYGRLFYDNLNQYATSFDIAVSVNTPAGMRYISYFDTMKDGVFNEYISRGAASRQDFVIAQEARDADPLQCNGETFVNGGNVENWVVLD